MITLAAVAAAVAAVAPSGVAAAPGDPGCASATAPPGACAPTIGPSAAPAAGSLFSRSVAIYDSEDVGPAQSLADVLNQQGGIRADALNVTRLQRGDLTRYDCSVARLTGGVTAATASALRSFAAAGGGYIGEWWGAGAALTGLAPVGNPYVPPSRFLSLFSGRATDGNLVGTDTPITPTRSHPVVRGLGSVFSGGAGTEFFVRPVAPYDARLSVLATYPGPGGATPAIMVGSAGAQRSVLLFFDAIDEPTAPSLVRLWTNSVRYACPAPRGLFGDGFESGGFGAWSTASGMTVQSADVAVGAYAARASSTGGPAFLTRQLGSSARNVYYRARVKVRSQGAGNAFLLGVRTASGATIASVARTPSGQLVLRDAVHATNHVSSTRLSAGSWHELQLQVKIGRDGASGAGALWLDGDPVVDLTLPLDLGSGGIGQIFLGQPSSGQPFDILYDNVTVGTGFVSA